MTTHITKTWFDGEKVITQEIPESKVYEQKPLAWADEIIDDLNALFDSEMIRENDSGDALIRLDAAICAVEEAEQRHTTPPAAQPAPVQEPVAWPCLIEEADFSQNTVTLAMQCEDYKVSAGKHWLYTTPPAAQQEPDAYGYAKCLAVAIWDQHYKDVAPQWKPFDNLMGVLTQIDNMTAGLTAQNQRQPLTDDRIGQIIEQCKITLVNYCSGEKQTEFARAIEAAHGIKEKNT